MNQGIEVDLITDNDKRIVLFQIRVVSSFLSKGRHRKHPCHHYKGQDKGKDAVKHVVTHFI